MTVMEARNYETWNINWLPTVWILEIHQAVHVVIDAVRTIKFSSGTTLIVPVYHAVAVIIDAVRTIITKALMFNSSFYIPSTDANPLQQ